MIFRHFYCNEANFRGSETVTRTARAGSKSAITAEKEENSGLKSWEGQMCCLCAVAGSFFEV